MNLPNFFLADLPPSAVPSAAMIEEACRTLKRNRERYLAARSTSEMVTLLCRVGEKWLDREFPLRRMAMEQGQVGTGFSRGTLESGLDGFFSEFRRENFQALLEQDLGGAERLDRFGGKEAEAAGSRMALCTAPEFVAHITAGNLPNPTLMSITLGVLMRSAQFVKCASGASAIPRLYAHSLYDEDPKLGACLEVAEWRGGRMELEQVLFDQADCVTATGSDEVVRAIARRVPAQARFLSYGHRVSFAYLSADVLNAAGSRRMVGAAATDVVAWNQLGCLSPHVVYVQTGGSLTALQFAEMLAGELERREQSEPRGELPAAAAAAIASRRSIYEMRAANSPETRMWCSKDSTAWTVVFEADPRFQASCLNRFVYVKPVANLTEALQNADHVRGKVSTVGIGVAEHTARGTAMELARWGVTRVCPMGRMQNPPLIWRHDGRPALGDMVLWTDWESGGAEAV